MWKQGPDWLTGEEADWPAPMEISSSAEVETELKADQKKLWSNAMMTSDENPFVDFTRYSSYSRLLNVVAYVQRFIRNCSQRRTGKTLQEGFVTREAEWTVIRLVQAGHKCHYDSFKYCYYLKSTRTSRSQTILV